MWRKQVVSAVVVCVIGISVANAGLILTIDGSNPTGIPLMLEGTGPYQVALDGNTTIEPNDVRFEAVGGTLTVISDVNHQYSFQYDTGSTAGLVWLITNIDITIDGIFVSANTTIYELFIFCNPDVNLTGACGSDLSFLLPPPEEEEEGGQGDSIIEQPAEPTGESAEQNPSETQNQQANDNASPPSMEEETESSAMSGEGGEQIMLETTNPEIPLYVQNCVKKVRTFKQGGSGKDILIINEVNESRCLDNKKIYYVPNPPLVIEGNDVRAYIPSDTIIVVEQSANSNSIAVRNGAKIITGLSNGQSNHSGIYPPVWIMSVNDVSYQHNLRGIMIEQTAGADSWINNIFINNCRTAIETRPLDYPIENLYADHCYKGIVYHGSGKVYNNQITNFGKIIDGIFSYEGRGIEFYPISIDGNETYAEAYYEANFNLVHNGDIGITARGTETSYVILYAKNNATSQCRLYAYDTTMSAWSNDLYNLGFYNNGGDSNDSYLSWNFVEPVYETNSPYSFYAGDYRAYLKQNSVFVNRGYGYSYDSEQPGWSPFANGSPDSNKTDIWVHHQTRIFTATADLNGDGIVDLNDANELMNYWMATDSNSDIDGDGQVGIYDLEIIAVNWLKGGTNLGDLNLDSMINFKDFALYGSNWAAKDPMYADLNGDKIVNSADYNIVTASIGQLKPALTVTDINGTNVTKGNINGRVFVDFNNFDANTYSLALYLDNLLLEKYVALNWYPVEIPSYIFSNGRHNLQLVSYDSLNNATVHKPVAVDFNNMIYYFDFNERFHPTQNFPLSGFTDLNSVGISFIAENNDILWSQDFNGPDFIEVNIPGSTFDGQMECSISFTSASGVNSITTASKSFLMSDYSPNDSNYKMAIILPNPELEKARRPAIDECIHACQRKGIKYIPLYFHDVIQENLETVLRDRSSIKYVYWVGHGNDFANNERTIQRTNLWIWDYRPSIWHRNWQRRNAYSWTHQSWPEWTPELPEDEGDNGLDLYRFWMSGTEGHTQFRKRLVFIDCCLSASYNDMAWIFGAFSNPSCNLGYYDQIYIGWRNIWEEGAIIHQSTEGVRLFWEDMGQGSPATGPTVYQAFFYVQTNGLLPVRTSIFGDNGSIDIEDPGFNPYKDQWRWLGCDTGHGQNAAQNVKLTNP